MATPRLTVIDYGGGNIGSLRGALDRRAVSYVLTEDADEVGRAEAVILPGDGAFAATMDALSARGLDQAVRTVVRSGRPFLGICVGMQLLFETSDEYGGAAGLGILNGHVRRFVDTPRIPHMGWNDLAIEHVHPFVAGLQGGEYAYFLHSYRVSDSDAVVATADYGGRFAAIVARDNVVATQFHPEKSQRTGGRLIDNFLAIAS